MAIAVFALRRAITPLAGKWGKMKDKREQRKGGRIARSNGSVEPGGDKKGRTVELGAERGRTGGEEKTGYFIRRGIDRRACALPVRKTKTSGLG